MLRTPLGLCDGNARKQKNLTSYQRGIIVEEYLNNSSSAAVVKALKVSNLIIRIIIAQAA